MRFCEGKCKNWISPFSYGSCTGGESQDFPAHCYEKPNPSDWTVEDCKLFDPVEDESED